MTGVQTCALPICVSELVPMLEKSLSLSVRAIRSDHDTECENAKMLTFCRERGITHNFSAPHMPQQNGVVERKNRTLQDMSRTMLLSSGLAPTYWAEAVNTACYIINRAMPRPILDKTPYELRSEEHTSELQSPLIIAYAVFCLKKKFF